MGIGSVTSLMITFLPFLGGIPSSGYVFLILLGMRSGHTYIVWVLESDRRVFLKPRCSIPIKYPN